MCSKLVINLLFFIFSISPIFSASFSISSSYPIQYNTNSGNSRQDHSTEESIALIENIVVLNERTEYQPIILSYSDEFSFNGIVHAENRRRRRDNPPRNPITPQINRCVGALSNDKVAIASIIHPVIAEEFIDTDIDYFQDQSEVIESTNIDPFISTDLPRLNTNQELIIVESSKYKVKFWKRLKKMFK